MDEIYQKFVSNLNISRNTNSYSKSKSKQLQKQNDSDQLLLTEIDIMKTRNPLENLHESYIKDIYSIYIFAEEIKDLKKDGNYNDICNNKISKLTLVKKVIDSFLFFYVNSNFNKIISNLNKLYLTELSFKLSLESVYKLKKNFGFTKKVILENHLKYRIKRQKKKNMSFVLDISKTLLNSFYKKLKNVNNAISNINYEVINELNNEIMSYSEFFKKSINTRSVHSLIIIERISNVILTRQKSINDICNAYPDIMFESDIDKYLDFCLISYQQNLSNSSKYVNVSNFHISFCLINLKMLLIILQKNHLFPKLTPDF